jgi:hypothetical protein
MSSMHAAGNDLLFLGFLYNSRSRCIASHEPNMPIFKNKQVLAVPCFRINNIKSNYRGKQYDIISATDIESRIQNYTRSKIEVLFFVV